MPDTPPSTSIWKLFRATNSVHKVVSIDELAGRQVEETYQVPMVQDVNPTLLIQLKLRENSCFLPIRTMSFSS